MGKRLSKSLTNKKVFLEIGSGGKRLFENSLTLDKEKIRNVDIFYNLENGNLPFKDKVFDGVYASHVLEHIQNFDQLMKEIHRVLKTKGKLIIKVPYGQSYLAKHPYHVRFFSLNSFHSGHNLDYQKLFLIKKRKFNMGITKYTHFLNILNPIINLSYKVQEFCEVFLFNFFIPPQELFFELEKID
ncbi:MAG: class I SAM-dependent methyltransferase [Candidatus Aenigmatarchaeota archaeon]